MWALNRTPPPVGKAGQCRKEHPVKERGSGKWKMVGANNKKFVRVRAEGKWSSNGQGHRERQVKGKN